MVLNTVKLISVDIIGCYSTPNFEVIYQTRETEFHWDIQTPRRELKIRCTAEYFWQIWGVWMADETLSRVFDISSQSKQKLRSQWRIKSSKSMLIKIGYPNLLHACGFLCFSVMMNYFNNSSSLRSTTELRHSWITDWMCFSIGLGSNYVTNTFAISWGFCFFLERQIEVNTFFSEYSCNAILSPSVPVTKLLSFAWPSVICPVIVI